MKDKKHKNKDKKNKNAPLKNDNDTNSIIYRRLDAALRREINIAIIDRQPPTYRGVHQQFQLDRLGINYHAFYRYARRIRAEAAAYEMAGALLPPEADVPALLPRILGQRLLETLAFESPTPRAVQRLTDSYRSAVTSLEKIRRHELLPRKTKLTPQNAETTNEFLKLIKEHRQDANVAKAILSGNNKI